jgi:hypothetical protein
MAKAKKGSKTKLRERRERHFVPRSTTNIGVVYALGGIGSAVLGAGAWAVHLASNFASLEDNAGKVPPGPLAYGWWIVALGAALVGIAIWIGTSGEAPIRVGDGGVGIDKGGVKRIAWNAITRIAWDGSAQGLIVHGHDESGVEHNVRVSIRTQPQALAWIVKEGRARVPKVVELSENELEQVPVARKEAGEVLPLEPLRVVGLRCAASEKMISYEPDARVCPQCERVYYKSEVPRECACGASLEALRGDAPNDAPAVASDTVVTTEA